MAIANHSGNITSDETWEASDEHHVTAQINVGNDSGGATVTVEENSEVYFDGSYQLVGINQANNVGKISAVATDWGNKILFQSDPTNIPKPGIDYSGLWNRFNGANNFSVTLKYCHVKHTLQGALVSGGAQAVCGDIDIQYCLFQSTQAGMTINQANQVYACDITFKNNIVYQSIGGAWALLNAVAGATFSGSIDVTRNYYLYLDAPPIGTVSTNLVHPVPFDLDDSVLYGRRQVFANIVGDGLAGPDFINSYIGHGGGWGVDTPHGLLMYGSVNQSYTFNVTGCVFFNNHGRCVYTVDYDPDDADFVVDKTDFVQNNNMAMVAKNGNGRGRFTNTYMYYNGNREWVENLVVADGDHYLNIENTPNTVLSTPNRPLEIDNISEGTPGENSVIITFDSVAGATSLRCDGVAFIKYGTTSGTYTEQTMYPDIPLKLAHAWTQVDTTHGEFKKTGHSVTINNLKPGTTYYYKCCFVDPLGRIAEGPEGSFTTTGASGGGQRSQALGLGMG